MFDRAYFFGTFNPVHTGHLIMATSALNQFNLNEICFVPAASPPHRKNDVDIAPFDMRLAMLRLACRDYPKFCVNGIEGRRPGPSYTIDTLDLLFPECGAAGIPILIGGDALARLGSWHRPKDLAERCVFLQAPRANAPPVTHVSVNGTMTPIQTRAVDMPLINISATQIRKTARNGQSVAPLTPPSVAKYIAWNRLYH